MAVRACHAPNWQRHRSDLLSAVPGSDSTQYFSSLSLGPCLADALSRCVHRLPGDLPVGWDPGQLPKATTAPQPQETATHPCPHPHCALGASPT